MNHKCLFFLLFVTNLGFAQLNFTFSDADFNKNANWSGNIDNFFVNNDFQLQSKAASASFSSIFTASEAFDDAIWQASLKITYPTSSSNYAVIFLTSDVLNVAEGCNAYYVQIGNTSDEVSLYLQQGTKKTKIIDGADKRTDGAEVNIKIKVTRDAKGNFALYSQLPTETNFVLEGVAQNTVIGRAAYFGLAFSNTASTGNAYAFDDIVVSGKAVPDNDPPKVANVKITNNNALQINFDEAVEITKATFNVDNEVGAPTKVEIKNESKSIVLTYGTDFATRKKYTLSTDNITDKAGNILQNTIYYFGMAEMAAVGDLYFNEIMFEHPANGAEYIEIINASDKVIDLSNYSITTRKADQSINTGVRIAAETILFPQHIIAFTNNALAVVQHHNCPSDAHIVELATWSALNNEMATIVLLNSEKNLLFDELTYDKKWHHTSLTTSKGVSLERLSIKLPSNDAKTWHSASFANNYGTPGFTNSQMYEPDAPSMQENTVKIVPEIFSPDNDGNDDYCFVHYKMSSAGNVGNVKVLNAQGVVVKQLLNNVLIDAEGVIRWDGTNDNQTFLASGIYVLYFEAIDATMGQKSSYKKPIVLTRR